MARGTIIPIILDDGSKRYQTVLRFNGRQVWKRFRKKGDAEDYLARNATDLREGTYRKLTKATFERYIQKWCAKYLIPEELKPSTLSGYAYVLAKHIVPCFGPRLIAAITTEDITDFRAAMLKAGQSNKSTKNLLNLLSRIFADATEDGYLRVSPMPTRRRKADKKVKSEAKGRALQPREAQRLLDQCDETLRLIVLIGLLAGLRRGEMFGLRWEDVDWDNDIIHVRQNLYFRHGKHHTIPAGEPAYILDVPKSEKSTRDVDLSPALKKELRTRYLKSTDKHGLIFQTANQTPLDPHNVYERWFKPAVERARKKAEEEKDKPAEKALNGLRIHDLRHTYGSWKVAQHEDIIYVAAQLGHARPSITADIYSHLLEKRRPAAATKTDAFLFGPKAAAD